MSKESIRSHIKAALADAIESQQEWQKERDDFQAAQEATLLQPLLQAVYALKDELGPRLSCSVDRDLVLNGRSIDISLGDTDSGVYYISIHPAGSLTTLRVHTEFLGTRSSNYVDSMEAALQVVVEAAAFKLA